MNVHTSKNAELFFKALGERTRQIWRALGERPALRFFVLLCLVAAVVEVFVFNAKTFTPRYGARELDLSKASLVGFEPAGDSGGFVSVAENPSIEFIGIGSPVGTLFLDADPPPGESSLTVNIDFSDSTNAGYRIGLARMGIIRGMPGSMHAPCHFSGEVGNLRLRFDVRDGGAVELRGVSINRQIPFGLSMLRLLVMICGAMLIYALARFPVFKREFSREDPAHTVVLFGLTAVLVIAALGLTLAYNHGRSQDIVSDFRSPHGNQITKDLVDTFEAGQIHFIEKPSAELLALDNPYDWSERTRLGIGYKWDHLLYNNRYYSYYGIAPVLLLFLPYHVMTGYYFPAVWAVFLFGALGIVFLSMLYMAIIRRWFSSLPFGMVVMGLAVIQVASGVWATFSSPLFYEIAQASAFMFTVIGGWALVSATSCESGRAAWARVFIGATALSLAVMSRPTTAVYAIVALVFLWAQRKKFLARMSVKSYLCSFLIPFIVFGGAQALYNYARFGSIFEFGIRYSLTINDFTSTQFHLRMAMIGFYNFLAAFPQIKPEFPFVFSQFSTLDVAGYYFVANRFAIGIFFRALPVFYVFRAGRAARLLPEGRRPMQLVWLLLCVVAPLVIIFSIWESGYGYRYSADFSWQIIIGALSVLYIRFIGEKESGWSRRAYNTMIAMAAGAVAVNAAIALEYMRVHLLGDALAGYLRFARVFEFWK